MKTYEWAIIGAGPAGIATVGNLIDHHIPLEDILWIDPHFTSGDFGTLWRNIPSNTKVDRFLEFLFAVDSFNYKNCTEDFPLNHAEKNATCQLNLMADALQWVSNQLQKKVDILEDFAENIFLEASLWHIQLSHATVQAKNVVLAMGAESKNLSLHNNEIIPLQDAMDGERIKQHLSKHDTVAVFGSSHSAILVLRNLVENNIQRIINFYRSPLCYAVYMKDYILFDDTGLKGPTADWARAYIDGELPKNLERFYSDDENVAKHLLPNHKVIYAVGFERRRFPHVENVDVANYVEQCGIIAPGLFGIGIAFPEAKINPLGMLEHRVGLWKFMDYLKRVIPIWLNYSVR